MNSSGWISMRALGIMLIAAGAMSAWAAPPPAAAVPQGNVGGAKCRSELSPEALDRAAGRGTEVTPEQPQAGQADPRSVLRAVVQQAVARSAAVGASKLLADAASFDLDQAQAGAWPLVGLSGSMGPQRSEVNGETTAHGRLSTLGVSASGPIYDAGRLREQVQWRKDLLRAEQWGLQQTGETVVSEAVATMLDRSRYHMQAQVYQQYVRKMQCLLEALEVIVSADRGRASEMVQARKTLAQVELSRDIAAAAARQVDIKLKRLLGDGFAVPGNFTMLLVNTPDAGEVRRLMEQSADFQQLQAQINASESYARLTEAARWPQLSWAAGSSQSAQGDVRTRAMQANVVLSVNLFDGGLAKAATDAAWTRAQATRQRYEELMATRHERISALHDSSTTSFRHAKRYADIIRDSDLVRSYTFQQWSQLGRRSLFDLMSSESDHFSLRIAYVNALFDGYQANAQLRSLAGGLRPWALAD